MSTTSVARPRALPLLLGESPALVELRRDIQAAARTEAKVLIASLLRQSAAPSPHPEQVQEEQRPGS